MNSTSVTLPPPDLLVVLPVYNEEDSIVGVVEEWLPELSRCVESIVLLAIDDGSTDDSKLRLRGLCEHYGVSMEMRSRDNVGHGASCLEGYYEAVDRDIPWVFQIDSDGQCDPRYFESLWQKRDECDVIYGARVWREDGLIRMAASWLLKIVLLVQERVYCVDPNSPYRLMRTSILAGRLAALDHVYRANVALSVLLRRDSSIRHDSIPIHFRKRSGGTTSIKLLQFGGRALELMSQMRVVTRNTRVK